MEIDYFVSPMDEETDILSSDENKFPDPEEFPRKCFLSNVHEDVMVQHMYQHFERNLPVGQNLFRGILSDRQHG